MEIIKFYQYSNVFYNTINTIAAIVTMCRLVQI